MGKWVEPHKKLVKNFSLGKSTSIPFRQK